MGRHIKHSELTRRSEPPHGNGNRASGRGHRTSAPRELRHEPRGPEPEAQTTLFDRVAQLLQEHLADRARRPVTDLGKLARALHLTSEQLEGNLAAPLLAKAAEGLEQAVGMVQRDGREVASALERFARDKPLVFCGSAIALGVSAGRFLKSSARAQREGTSHEPQSAEQAAP